MPDLSELESHLGYTFQNIELLKLALTHPSVAYEAPGGVPHNQRLEFLGDAVLSLVLTHELYEKFPGYGEGPLTKARAQMVNRSTLATEAQRLDLGQFLILSRGEDSNGGRQRPSSLADALEAVLGAVFLDGGYDAATLVILRCFKDAFGELSEIPSLVNPKGELQELLQTGSTDAPFYEMTSMEGPDHDRIFECAVFHGGTELARGQGKSKKAAESQAAFAALEKLRSKDS